METSTPESPVHSLIAPSNLSSEKCLLRHFCRVSEFTEHSGETYACWIPGVFASLLFLDFLIFQSHSVKNYFIFIIKGGYHLSQFLWRKNCPPLQRKVRREAEELHRFSGTGWLREASQKHNRTRDSHSLSKYRDSERVSLLCTPSADCEPCAQGLRPTLSGKECSPPTQLAASRVSVFIKSS